MSACSSSGPKLTAPTHAYREALQRTDPAEREGLEPGSEAEQEAIQRVIDLFAVFSEENVSQRVRGVYADTLFFRDGFKEFHEIDPLAEYMIESTKPLRECTFDFEEPVINDGDYYLRWTMNVSLNSDPEGYMDRAIGMSHIRFNQEGKVIFQQDYWDPTDVLYDRIPVANWLIKKVKERL
jgi:hypothetical protein